MNDTQEVWESLNNGYSVSNIGRVKSYKKDNVAIIKSQSSRGYRSIKINGKRMFVHRLVAIAFLDNPNNFPVVNHLDGRKDNNIVRNLEWCTQKSNVRHAMATGLRDTRGEKSGRAKLSEANVKFLRENRGVCSSREFAAIFGVTHTAILHAIKGINWSYLNEEI